MQVSNRPLPNGTMWWCERGWKIVRNNYFPTLLDCCHNVDKKGTFSLRSTGRFKKDKKTFDIDFSFYYNLYRRIFRAQPALFMGKSGNTRLCG